MHSELHVPRWPRVIGQHRVKNNLLAVIKSGRLPHAYLFIGNEGVGKDAMALEFARVLLCSARGEEACDTCQSCQSLNSMQHPDVRFITALPTGKGEDKEDGPLDKLSAADISAIQEQYRLKAENPYHRISIPRANQIKINSVRDLRRESAMSSLYKGRRIFIISNADEMNDASMNTLLKTLEEPPPDTLIILTTARPELLLQTIISRCQTVRFEPLREQEIEQALVEREHVENSQAALVARLANGSYIQALELLQTDVGEMRTQVLDFVRTVVANKFTNLAEEIEKLSAGKDRERVVRFLSLMMIWFRDAYVMMNGGEIINRDQSDALRRFVANFPHADVAGAMQAVDHSISLIYKNGYIPLTLFQLGVRLRRCVIEPSPSQSALTLL